MGLGLLIGGGGLYMTYKHYLQGQEILEEARKANLNAQKANDAKDVELGLLEEQEYIRRWLK